MAHLVDMEEKLASISSREVRLYMREAMACYMTGAYRGCIVLSFIALFDDLLKKIEELGKINAEARKIHKEAKKKRDDQQVFETYLIDQLGSNNLMPKLDTFFLKTLRDLRNKSAHPSGHKPSAEEARFFFFEVIDRFLGKPILTTRQFVEEISERLEFSDFFPSTSKTELQEIVSEELEHSHPEILPLLIEKLVEKSVLKKMPIPANAGKFLVGLALKNEPEINKLICRKLISKKIGDEKYSLLILRLISSNHMLLSSLSKASMSRFQKILSTRIQKLKVTDRETLLSHPITVLKALIENMSDDDLAITFSSSLKDLFKIKPYSKLLIETIKSNPKAVRLYLDELIKKAGSNDFNIANSFANSVDEIDPYLAKIIPLKEAFELIVNILKASDSGSFGAADLKATKFSSLPETKAVAKKYIIGNKISSKKIYNKILNEDKNGRQIIELYFS